jgi:hypothetical protein
MQTGTNLSQNPTALLPESPLKYTRIAWILVILNVLMAIMSTNFFLGTLKTGVEGWLMMNTCAPSIALFVIGYLLGSPIVMIAGAVAMFRYGTLGLFVFSWSGSNLIAQVGHILMTLAVAYVVIDTIRNRRWKIAGLGVALGLAIMVPFMIAQDAWIKTHAAVVEQLFNGTLGLP